MFDGELTLTKREKLQRLLTLLDDAKEDQTSWCWCLGHQAMSDHVLIAAGIPTERQIGIVDHGGGLVSVQSIPKDMEAFAAFFGLRSRDDQGLWDDDFLSLFGGTRPILKKIALTYLIAEGH